MAVGLVMQGAALDLIPWFSMCMGAELSLGLKRTLCRVCLFSQYLLKCGFAELFSVKRDIERKAGASNDEAEGVEWSLPPCIVVQQAIKMSSEGALQGSRVHISENPAMLLPRETLSCTMHVEWTGETKARSTY
jgi:hypothetical protein